MRALFPGRDEEGVKSGQFTDTTQFRQMGIGYCGRCGIGRLHGLRSCRRRGHRYGACCFRRGKGRMENRRLHEQLQLRFLALLTQRVR